MRKLLLIVFFLASLSAYANPAPFGLEIGEATIKDVTKKYSAKKAGINEYSRGKMYKLDITDIKFDGLRSALAIFNSEGTLVAILTSFSEEKFNYLYDNLKGKYHQTFANVPFVGNKKVEFSDDETIIILDAPHMSFAMEMNYIHKALWRKFKQESNEKNTEKQQQETSQL